MNTELTSVPGTSTAFPASMLKWCALYASVLEAMQRAEELGGPDDAAYILLMERIAAEATRRAAACRER